MVATVRSRADLAVATIYLQYKKLEALFFGFYDSSF